MKPFMQIATLAHRLYSAAPAYCLTFAGTFDTGWRSYVSFAAGRFHGTEIATGSQMRPPYERKRFSCSFWTHETWRAP
jgi:hypothetical protein